jgi:3-phosphoshikimate 1-carboxyvinyltransferase
MQLQIKRSQVSGTIQAPSSKSYTIRALMCAALAQGRSELVYPLISDDTVAAGNVLEHVGVKLQKKEGHWIIEGDRFQAPDVDLYCGDSAATLRFMCALCSLVTGRCRLTAGSSLSKRPVGIVVDALRGWGVDIQCEGNFAPVHIQGSSLKGGVTEIRGDISSQFISALLLVASQGEKGGIIKLTTSLDSASYIIMTLECLRKFGINVEHSNDMKEFKAVPQNFIPARYVIEGDWSSASYLLGLGALIGEVKVKNLNPDSLQGDRVIVDMLRQMGARVSVAEDYIIAAQSDLKGIKADLNECIDLLPTVAVLAAMAEGTSEFTGVRRARFKESNRISAVRQGLERAGIHVEEEEDRLVITGGKLRNAVIDSHNDHRIAMAFSMMGAAAGGVRIENAECVSKTYPAYWDALRKLGVMIDER